MNDADRIELHGLRVMASVGALPEEKERRQPLAIDLDLADTVDYGLVCQRVEELVVGGSHTVLLEALAEKIAARVLGLDERILGVTVTVRKLRPPVPQDLATSGVRISRARH